VKSVAALTAATGVGSSVFFALFAGFCSACDADDCEAFRFQGGEAGWELAGTIESKGRPGLGEQREESALNMFRQMDLRGKSKDDTQLKTVHQNTITMIRPYAASGNGLSQFSSSGVDGRIVVWNA
jgi:actin related protein 2/3 complex subunit 1A/1B